MPVLDDIFKIQYIVLSSLSLSHNTHIKMYISPASLFISIILLFSCFLWQFHRSKLQNLKALTSLFIFSLSLSLSITNVCLNVYTCIQVHISLWSICAHMWLCIRICNNNICSFGQLKFFLLSLYHYLWFFSSTFFFIKWCII